VQHRRACKSNGRAVSLPALLSVLAAVTTAPPSLALQVIEARDGVAVEAIVSIKEPTRIRIDGAPITDVFGNIHSTNCGGTAAAVTGTTPIGPAPAPPVNPSGEFVLECDRDKGEIYIRPVGESSKPINLFVSSGQATYTLLLRRSDTPADTIVISDKAARMQQSSTAPQGALGPSANHIRAMKALLVAMASDRVPPDVRVEELGQPVQLWAEARFTLMRRYEGRGLVGETYQLQNVSASVMVLAEQEFDREEGQVAGIAIEHHNLQPGEATSVFVIRRRGAR